ncbi:kinase binding protein CGI-121-domain-containing protein [Exophiala viscosa]|uniref:EKC/KEOPS complex subunit CGI121 n=1 Tax=Exophiala viscosa TaxID=2486360 RepID=A0AAN6DNX3_9EURO|nr:kinase binding protein CGI-121-domain-containing protein [Exophiala viscosa]KAI1620484.1 kinase binding protein CGI-121-domain-containing protein [Exophiala viscosa]
MVETVHLSHMPPELALFAALYTDVENASFLKDQLLAGNADFEYAFIDASMVLSTTHVLAATFRAMNDYINDRLKSRNVHSEIVFCLSPNNNIGEAFRRFGVSETTKDLLVLKVATTPQVTLDSVSQHLSSNIHGKECAFDDASFRKIADVDRLRKVYKLGAPQTSKGKGGSKPVNGTTSTSQDKEVDTIRHLETQILGVMALRGAT